MKNNNETPNEKLNRLRTDNEEKKKLLTEEYGAVFGGKSGESELPPELENQFPDNIRNFENDFYKSFLTKEAEDADWHLHFRQAFSSFQVKNFSINDLICDTEKAVVQFDCDFAGTVEGDTSSLQFKGMGEMNLLYQWDYWCIDKIKLPKSTTY